MVDDAAKFVTKEGHETYDCIVVDSSDPVGTYGTSKRTLIPLSFQSQAKLLTSLHFEIKFTGPAEALFEPAFFRSLHQALNTNGIICTQAECQWLHLDFIAKVYKSCCDVFPQVEYAYTSIPTYPSGQIGFMLLSNSTSSGEAQAPLRTPARTPSSDVQAKLRFYNPALHTAAFALPEFARRKLEEARGGK